MRRFDVGISSYGRNWKQLEKTFASIIANSVTDFRVFVCHNPSDGDELTKEAICRIADRDSRFVPIWMESNRGYSGAVNEILKSSTTEYIGYCDNDILIQSPGWDETLCGYLDRFHEIGLMFPNGGAYQIDRGAYTEIQWGVGFCFVMSRLCYSEVGGMDESIGHQNECDLCLRVRMGGWKCAAAPQVRVHHEATATNDPASNERIARGVREFVDKWCKYFGGKNLNYHSTNVLRWEDWHPNALYMEEYWKTRRGKVDYYQGGTVDMSIADLNEHPDVATIDGRKYDLIRVPRFSGFYTGRTI